MSDTAAEPKLTPKQQKFIDLYIGSCHFNASAAALEAGYSKRQSAGDVLSNPVVRARIDAELRKSAVSRDETLALLREDALRTDEEILALARRSTSSPAGEAAAISALSNARTKAREHLAKVYGLFTENVNLGGSLKREITIVRDPKAQS